MALKDRDEVVGTEAEVDSTEVNSKVVIDKVIEDKYFKSYLSIMGTILMVPFSSIDGGESFLKFKTDIILLDTEIKNAGLKFTWFGDTDKLIKYVEEILEEENIMAQAAGYTALSARINAVAYFDAVAEDNGHNYIESLGLDMPTLENKMLENKDLILMLRENNIVSVDELVAFTKSGNDPDFRKNMRPKTESEKTEFEKAAEKISKTAEALGDKDRNIYHNVIKESNSSNGGDSWDTSDYIKLGLGIVAVGAVAYLSNRLLFDGCLFNCDSDNDVIILD